MPEKPERVDFRHEGVNFRPEWANFRSEGANFRSERADFRPERADFRPERADFRPGGDKRMNKQTKVPAAHKVSKTLDSHFWAAAPKGTKSW